MVEGLSACLTDRIWKEFTPGGREGTGLVLHHWVKKGSVEDENGSYSKEFPF